MTDTSEQQRKIEKVIRYLDTAESADPHSTEWVTAQVALKKIGERDSDLLAAAKAQSRGVPAPAPKQLPVPPPKPAVVAQQPAAVVQQPSPAPAPKQTPVPPPKPAARAQQPAVVAQQPTPAPAPKKLPATPTKPKVAASAPVSKLGQELFDESKKKEYVKGHDTRPAHEKDEKPVGTSSYVAVERNVLKVKEGDQVERAREYKAEAGAEGHAKKELGDKQGLHGEVRAKGEVAVNASAGGRYAYGKTEDGTRYASGEVHAETSAKARGAVGGKIAYADDVSAEIELAAEVGASARAHAQGLASANKKGVVVSAGAGAEVEVHAAADVTTKFVAGDVGLDVVVGVDASAFAGVDAEGTFEIGASGIVLEYNVGVRAGAKVTARGESSFTISEREFFALTGEASATAGAALGGSGTFKIKNGKIEFAMGVGAAAGVGLDAGGSTRVNLNPIASVIGSEVQAVLWQLSPNAKDMIDDTKEIAKAKTKLITALKKYAAEKRTKVLAGNAEHYVNLDTLQMHVDKYFPRSLLKGKGVDPSLCDTAITEAIKESVEHKPNEELEFTVVAGKVSSIKNLAEYKSAKAKKGSSGSAMTEITDSGGMGEKTSGFG